MARRQSCWPRRLLVGLAVAALSACGSGDDGSAATGTADGADTTEGTGASDPGTPAQASTTLPDVERPDSMAEWEALWADQRASVVQRVEDNGWGTSADGTTLTGPAGFSVDLSACPDGWSDTEGVSDTTIKIGHTLGLSGIYASNGTANGIATVLEHYGAEGAFEDSEGRTRTVEYLPRDDAADPARTPALTDELIDSEKVFADITSASANTFRVYDKLNQRCIPNPVILSGHPAWGDPVNHPWTAGYVLAYTTESVMWGAFIDEHVDELPEGEVTIATLALDNDYGKVATDALAAYLEDSPNADRYELVSEKIELGAPVITDPMTTLASRDPEFLFVMVGGGQCAAVINEAAQNGMHQNVEYLFLPNICLPVGPATRESVGGDGMQADGWWVVNGGGVDLKDQHMADDAFVSFARELLQAGGYDPDASGDFTTGVADGWLLAQVLQIAGQLPGGLTRTNFVLAERTMNMTSPMLLEGMHVNMNGNADAYLFESAVFQKWDAAAQAWRNQGQPIDLSGRSAPCEWDGATSVCR